MAERDPAVEPLRAWEAELSEITRLMLEVERVRSLNLSSEALDEKAIVAKGATAEAMRTLENAQRTQAAIEHVQRERVAGTTLAVGTPIRSLR